MARPLPYGRGSVLLGALRIGIVLSIVVVGRVPADVGPLSLPVSEASERIAALRRELVHHPADADRWTELAWLLYRYGQDTKGASEAAGKACGLAPEHFKAREIAGRLAFLSGHEEQAFEHWLHLVDGERPETEMYLADIGALARTQEDRALVRERMQRVAGGHPNHLFRTIAQRYLAQDALAKGEIDEAQRLYGRQGVIDQWMIVGPFENERGAGYNVAYRPETEIDFQATYPGRNQTVSWRRLEHLTFDRYVDFAAVCFPREQVLAYAVTFVHSPTERPATIRLGVSKSVKVWFNERAAFESELDRGFAPDQVTIPVVLRRGFNKLLVKVGTETGSWKLAARLTDPQGQPLDVVSFSRDVQETPDERDADAPSFVYTPAMMDHFARLAAVEPNNEDALYYLGIAQNANELTSEASKTLEHLVNLNDGCADHHRLLARAYLRDDKAEKALAELKRGIALGPGNLQLRLMLTQFYNGRRLYQKEREILKDIEADRPDWRLLQFQWIDNYGGEGWEELAFRKLQRIRERSPTDLQVLVAYAGAVAGRGFKEDYDRTVASILDLDQAHGFALRERLTRAVAREDYDEAFKVYDVLQRLNPTAYDLRLDRAKLLMALKRYDEALEQCRLALDICPTDAAIHEQIGTIHQRMGEDEAALGAYRTALRYLPENRSLRQYVEYMEPEENAAFARYAVGEDDINGLLGREITAKQYPKSGAVFVLDEMVTQVFEDGSSTHRIHQIIKVLDESGRDQWNRVDLPPGTNKVKYAVVIQPDGNEVEAARITNSGIDFAQLQAGSVIDYVTIGYAPPNDWISHHYNETFLFQSDDPMMLSRFVVLAPESKPISSWYQGDEVVYRMEGFEGQKVHVWEARDMPRVQSEPNLPPFIDVAAQVRVGTIRNWDEIAHWEHSLIKDQFAPDLDLMNVVQELTAGMEGTFAKIKALADFVAQDIQYKIVRGGIFGYKPNKAGNVLHNEWGDCKDKATLLITMLEQAGIDAEYVTIRTRDIGRLVEEIPANQCNHAIVHIPKTGDMERDLWVDGTARDQGISALPWVDQDVTALVWNDDGSMRLMKTPLEPADNTVSRFDLNVSLRPDGGAEVVGKWTSTGQVAASVRNAFRQVGQRAERLTQLLNAISAGSYLIDFSFSDMQDRDRPVVVDMRFAASSYAAAQNGELTVRTTRPFRVTSQFAPRDVRYYDVWLPFRQKLAFAETFHAPDGYEFVAMPEPVVLTTPWLEYRVDVSPQGKAVRIERSLAIQAVTIPRDDYDQLRAFCVKVDEYENQSVARARQRK